MNLIKKNTNSTVVSVSSLHRKYRINKDECINMCKKLGIQIHNHSNKGKIFSVLDEVDAQKIIGKFKEEELYYKNKDKFFTADDAKELFGKTREAFLANRRIQAVIKREKYKNKIYFYSTDIQVIKDIYRQYEARKKDEYILYSGTKVRKELKINQRTLDKLFRDGFFSNSYIKKVGKVRRFYFAQEDIDKYKEKYFYKFSSKYERVDVLANKYKIERSTITKNIFNKHYVGPNLCYCLIEDVEILYNELQNIEKKQHKQNEMKIFEYKNDDYSQNKDLKESIYNNNFDQLSRKLHLSNVKLAELVKQGEFPLTKVIRKDGCLKFIIDDKDIKSFIEKYKFAFSDDYCLISLAASNYGYTYEGLKYRLNNIYNYFSKRYCLKKEAESIYKFTVQKERLLKDVLEKNDKVAAYDYYLLMYREKINNNINFNETIAMFDKFIKQEIDKSKSHHLISVVYNNGKALTDLVDELKKYGKELYELNRFQVDNILFEGKELSKSVEISLGKFINYVRVKKGIECKYDTVIRRKGTKPKKEKEVYDFNMFMKYAKYVSNYDLHIYNALNNPKYVQIWLYSIFHFCTAWRSSDILNFPDFPEYEALGYDKKWFLDNKLSDYECEILIKLFNDNYFVSNKTNSKIIFQVFELFRLSFATALSICEINRLSLNKQGIFYAFKRYKPARREIEAFLRKDNSLPAFTSIALNRSFIANFYEYTTKESHLHNLAYFLSRKLRGHKSADMTWEYINSLPSDSVNTCSALMFENDTFGYIKYFLSEIIAMSNNEKFDKMSLNEKRDYMINKYDLPNIIKIEAFSKTLLLENQLKLNIVEELLKCDSNQLIKSLSKIYRQVSPTYVKNIQCLNNSKCPYEELNQCCEGCKYAIYNKQFLYELNKKVFKMIDKLNDLSIINDFEIRKNIIFLQKLILILKQATDEKLGFGKNVVDLYINTDKLAKKLREVLHNYCTKLINDIIDDNKYGNNLEAIISKIPIDLILYSENIAISKKSNYIKETADIDLYCYTYILKIINDDIINKLEKSSFYHSARVGEEIDIIKLIMNKLTKYKITCNEIKNIVNFPRIYELL